jgi:hypothetical protein
MAAAFPAPSTAPDNAAAFGSGWRNLVLQPKVTCEFINGPPEAILTNVNASVATSIGLVASSWRLNSCPAPSPTPAPSVPTPAPPGSAHTCGLVLEKDKFQPNTTGILDLNCGPTMGGIDTILFADFGIPDGSCTTGFTVNSSCSSNNSVSIHHECRFGRSLTTQLSTTSRVYHINAGCGRDQALQRQALLPH